MNFVHINLQSGVRDRSIDSLAKRRRPFSTQLSQSQLAVSGIYTSSTSLNVMVPGLYAGTIKRVLTTLAMTHRTAGLACLL